MKAHAVCLAEEIPVGGKKLVTVGSRDIVIYHLDGGFFGLVNKCPHEGGSLFHGPCIGLLQSQEPGDYGYSRRGEIVRCPWHGWEFDIRSGAFVGEPEALRVRKVSVTQEHLAPAGAGGSGPADDERPTATTVPVEREGDYLVVRL